MARVPVDEAPFALGKETEVTGVLKVRGSSLCQNIIINA
ncbi:Uncharacterised protein [uncultured archaeon]|nr:Uncharacterised protein [uncultured archaeon]